MTEIFLSFLWKHNMFLYKDLQWEGESIEILNPGQLNTNAGPDYIDARIKIGDTLWAGNVEIHINSSDWEEHNHDQNPAFDNIVLHVVFNYNKDIYTSKGRKVPTIVLKFENAIWDNYQNLMAKDVKIPCANSVKNIDPFTIQTWLQTLSIERLENKIENIQWNLKKNVNDWEETFFNVLCHAFGFHVNSTPFILLAQNTPNKTIKKHSNNLHETEAILFGQAGFLQDDHTSDPYYNELKKTYDFFKSKYNLKTIDVHLWKFLRLRPGNFPTIRLAQLAGILYNNQSLLTSLLNSDTLGHVQKLLNCSTSEYWLTHYTFSNTSVHKAKPLGFNSLNNIIINTIVPFFYAFGELTQKPELKDRSFEFLDKLPSEKNSIVKDWNTIGIKTTNASESQALIQLTNSYCVKKRCIECRIGLKIINKKDYPEKIYKHLITI